MKNFPSLSLFFVHCLQQKTTLDIDVYSDHKSGMTHFFLLKCAPRHPTVNGTIVNYSIHSEGFERNGFLRNRKPVGISGCWNVS